LADRFPRKLLTHSGATFISTAFIDSLRQYGYVEGRNPVIEVRFAQGHGEQYPQLVRELLQANVELVVTTQTPAALTLKESTKTLPGIMLGVADPVETGLVQSLARPGGNITRLSGQVGDLDGKVVPLARELVPKLSHPPAVQRFSGLLAEDGFVGHVTSPACRSEEQRTRCHRA